MDIFKYAEEIILSMGGNEADIEQITEEIKENGYTTIEEVKSHLENYYMQEVNTMEDRRKVLFTNGMSNDFMLIITDAPQKAIESYCYRVNKVMEDGEHIEPFDTLKAKYYVKELLDSEIDDREDAEIIGWSESYDLCNYYDNLIATIEEDCKEWERLNNDGKMIEEYLYLNKCNNSEESGIYQLILNGMELWYGTLAEINAVVKSMIYRLTKDYTVQKGD